MFLLASTRCEETNVSICSLFGLILTIRVRGLSVAIDDILPPFTLVVEMGPEIRCTVQFTVVIGRARTRGVASTAPQCRKTITATTSMESRQMKMRFCRAVKTLW